MSKWTIAIVATLAVSVFAPSAQAGLVNGDFETTENITTGGWPETFGDWVGDAASFVGTNKGISPQSGSQMIRFDGSDYRGAHPTNVESQLGQLVDLTPTQGNGTHTAEFSGWFNRVSGDAQTDTEFRVEMYAMQGNPANSTNMRVNDTYLEKRQSTFQAAPNNWQELSTAMLIPNGTDFLLVFAVAVENVFNDASNPEYDGHYGDNFQLNITAPIGDDDGDDDYGDDDDDTPRATLTYDQTTGEVTLDTLDSITQFTLMSPNEFLGGTIFPNPPGSNIDLSNVIRYTDLSATGWTGIISLGEILNSGYTKQELIDTILTSATFYVDGTNGPWDFEIDVINEVPEPLTMSLLATGGLAVLLRRRKK